MARAKQIIRLGIIGCGRVAEERHLGPLRSLPEFRVVATADLDPARSERLARRLGAAMKFDQYRAVLDRPDVDAVAILTPTSSHAEIGIAALAAGKHVLVEKPLALTLEDCDRLISAEAQSPCKVVVGFNLRWHRLVRRASEFLATGVLGRIKAVRSAYTHDRTGETAPDWHRKLELGGGVSFNEAVHHFDLWRYFAGEVEQVFSMRAPSEHYDDETDVIIARFASGALATGVFSLRTGPTSELEIYGELGRLCLSLYRFDGMEFFPHSTYPGDLKTRFRTALASVGSLPQAAPILQRGGDFQATFSGLWQHFSDCILNDLPSQCTLQDGKNAMRITLAAIQSAGVGLPVQL
jgi:myo-inositol 2-dehydrogenase / D-chiro-inositol 1-dehydrogenase